VTIAGALAEAIRRDFLRMRGFLAGVSGKRLSETMTNDRRPSPFEVRLFEARARSLREQRLLRCVHRHGKRYGEAL